MDVKDLNSLSKKELIDIIENLRQKYKIGADDIQKANINYPSLLEATSDIIFVLDKEGNLIYINSAWKSFYPSWAGQSLGGHFSKNIPSIEKERAAQVFHEVIQKGTSFENEIMKTYNEKGDKIYFTASFSPVRSDDGTIIGIVGIMKNITEKYIAEKKLKEYSRILEIKVKEQVTQAQEIKGLRDLNEDIINHAPVGIFVMDPSGFILSENPALKQIMAHSSSETLVGSNLVNDPGFPESKLGKLYDTCYSTKNTGRVFNIPYRAANGRELIINATVIPILDKGGQIEKIIFMVEDHTEQAVITTRAYEAEKLSALGILASGVATELRNCVNQMVMDLNFIDNNIGERNPAVEYVEALHHEVGRIKNITEQLVCLSSADDEDKDLCDLNKILSSHSVEVMLKRLRAEGFTISMKPSPENPVVRANPNQLQQLFIQFIENAEEAMPEKGSIDISIGTQMIKEARFAVITITDSGVGIPPENYEKIFKPFYTTKGAKATGLGLMITSSIVQNLGGSIGLKSRPGEGTSFRIVLPVVDKSN